MKRSFLILALFFCVFMTNAQENNDLTYQCLSNGGHPAFDVIETDTVRLCADAKAEFNGGDNELRQWLSKNFHYPEAAREQKIQGTVIVRFVIDKKGELTDMEIVKSVHPLLDSEVMRLTGRMPLWIPAKKEGIPLYSRYSLPVVFKLN